MKFFGVTALKGAISYSLAFAVSVLLLYVSASVELLSWIL